MNSWNLLWIFRFTARRGPFRKTVGALCAKTTILLAVGWLAGPTAFGQVNDGLVGVWDSDQGFRTFTLLFRSNGRYQLDTQSTDPNVDLSSTERGQYQLDGPSLTLTPYDYLVRPDPRRYQLERTGDSLSLTDATFGQIQSFQLRAGSEADVRAREGVDPGLVGVWRRHVAFYGNVECTFRPDGYYVVKETPDNPLFAIAYLRGRYEQTADQLTLKPYSDAPEIDEMDFFGNELTLITTDDFRAQSATFTAAPDSRTDVQGKAAEAEAFLARKNWQVGVWEVRDPNRAIDLTLRPDGYYVAEQGTGLSKEVVRGRYTLDLKQIHLFPFIGQDLSSHSGGEFGNAERIRQLDYYDGQLQLIDLAAVVQSVTTARKRVDSEASVTDKVRQAQAEQADRGWCNGIWSVNDPVGSMEFTFRPDQRYIGKSRIGGVLKEMERGRYRIAAGKLTLAPYPNLGEPRGFQTDLYDGVLLLIGDPYRMVVARKLPGSEAEVNQATTDPIALSEPRGPLIGLWTLSLNGYHAELLFRPDGQFRLARCAQDQLSLDYGLYSVDIPTRTLVLDSRLAELETPGVDLYGGTMTLISTNWGFPVTYFGNPGGTDAALQTSMAADAQEAKLNANWLTRVPVGPRNPGAEEIPGAPLDLEPDHVFDAPTVFTEYRHYQRLIPSFVNFGDYETVPVANVQDWHFLRNGRVLIQFTQYVAGGAFPAVIPQVVRVWGAYGIEPIQATHDILHLYAENLLRIETDAREQMELTLENGRRHLFWGKDRAVLENWTAEQLPSPCQPPVNIDPSQMNTGVSLRSAIAPDELDEPIRLNLVRSVAGILTVQGTNLVPATLVTEYAKSLTAPVHWEALQTNAFSAGPFEFTLETSTNVQRFYRLQRP